MTTIAWDGMTLAADKRATSGSLTRTVTKLYRVRGALCALSADDLDYGMALLAWYEAGADPAAYPPTQALDAYAQLLVVHPSELPLLLRYGRTAHPARFEDVRFAMGSGRDYALAAMACGKSAREAVEIAHLFDACTGPDVDTLRFAPKPPDDPWVDSRPALLRASRP